MPHRKKNTQQQRQWRRMDLHLHTPASSDYKQPNVTYLDLLRKAEEKKLDIIAFADHNSVNGYARYLEEVESLELLERLGRLRDDERSRLEEYRRLRAKILILPGFEFTATLGFHILGVFGPDATIRELEHLLLMLRVPPDKLDQGSGEVGATTDALTAYRMIHEAEGLAIAAHANSSHGVAMPGFDFGGQTRIAYTQDTNLDALEVTDLDSRSRRRTAAFFSGTKPEYPRRMHCIQGSDAHKLDFDQRYKNEMGVGDRATEILLDELSFDAIKDVFEGSDFSRTRPYRPDTEEPFDPIREAREQGDSLIQSFHERLHEKRGIARTILEDVVALANTNGGTIFIGVSSNPKTTVLGVDRPDQASAELRSAISKEITPPLDVQVEVIKSQSKNLLQVIVPRGSEAPYALESTFIYVRSENETGLAVRDEIVQLVRDALAVELAANAPLAALAERPLSEPERNVETPRELPVAPVAPPVDPPRTGVEIVSSEHRKGVTYYSVRDLRNNRIVQNVTRTSARRLWQYAIEEQEKHPCDADKVAWNGNVGICKSHKRGGKVRYDLVQRADGKLLIYYGVTEDGIHGEWRKLVESEIGAEGEEAAAPEQRIGITPVVDIGPAEGIPTELEETIIAQEAEATAQEPEDSGHEVSAAEAPDARFGAPHREEQLITPPNEPAEPLLLAPGLAETNTPESPAVQAHELELVNQPSPTDKDAGRVSRETPGDEPEQNRKVDNEAPLPTPTAPISSAPKQPAPAQPAQPKSRAQQWREILDRAMADARAAQQRTAQDEGSPTNERASSPEQASPSDSGIDHGAELNETGSGDASTEELGQNQQERDRRAAKGNSQQPQI